MIKRVKLGLLATAGMLLITNPVMANDYSSGIVTKSPGTTYTDVEYGSGWYLRGDIIVNFEGKQSTESRFAPGLGFGGELDAVYEDVVGARIGAGYYVTPNFRVEATAEYQGNTDFSGETRVTLEGIQQTLDPISGAVVIVDTNALNGRENIEATYTASNFMLSGYYDLGQVGRITPYVGAGLGVSRVETTERRTLDCLPDSSQACTFPTTGTFGQTIENQEILNQENVNYLFAYQLSVGAAYQLTNNMSLDVGYTYFSTGDGDSISYSDGTAIDSGGFSAHKVNVGVRYELW